MTHKTNDWPLYVHDESQVCQACAGNGFVLALHSRKHLHPYSTCAFCCGSGLETHFLERKAA